MLPKLNPGRNGARSGFVPTELYRRFVRAMPLVCVDILAVRRGRFLLVRRALEPSKGAWWFPGGRLRKGERVESAAARILQDETGLVAVSVHPVGFLEYQEARSRWRGVPIHTVSIVMHAVISSSQSVQLDRQSSGYRWARGLPREIDRRLHPFVERLA